MEGEIGVMRVCLCGKAASTLKPAQHAVSLSLEGLMAAVVQKGSYRECSALLDRILRKEGEAKLAHTTLKDRVVSFGGRLYRKYEEVARDTLKSYGVDPESGIPSHESHIPVAALNPKPIPMYDKERAKDEIMAYNAGRPEEEKIKDVGKVSRVEMCADDSVYISIDDIGVKSQKEERKKGGVKTRKYVENTVVHVMSKEGQYTLTAIGMRNALVLLMAFLLANRLMENRRLVFLSDGARAIKENVATYFSFRQYELILDWLHLKKKCKELLSMSIKGQRVEKHCIREKLNRILWAGNTDEAIDYLEKLDASKVKSKDKLAELTAYLERKKPYIACYALRYQAHLRISSNRVEKANDLVVANRQKHNGMSWSSNGSAALATITAARLNGELDYYIKNHVVIFKPVAA